jgi:ABC-type bacteriocin/lantibiotic exporter with double-glycine peptidase domain
MINNIIKYISIITNAKEKLSLKKYFLFFILLNIFETISVVLLPAYLSSILNKKLLIEKIESSNINLDLLKDFLYNENLFLYFGIIILIFFILKFLISLNFFIFDSRLFNNLKINLSSKLFKIYLSKNYLFHMDNNPIILGRNITAEVNITVGFIRSFILIIKELLQILLIVILLLFVNVKFTLSILVIFAILSFVYLKIFSKKLKKKFNTSFFERGEKSKIVNQILNAFIEVKLYKKTNFFIKLFHESISREFSAAKYLEVLNKLPKILIEILIVLIFFLSIIFINKFNISLNIILPYLSLYLMAALRIYPSINNIIIHRLSLISGQISIEKISTEFKNLDIDVDKNFIDNNFYPEFKFENVIKFENVSYGFKNRGTILENLNFNINKKDFVGIIGETGSGKSTLVKLIMGFIKPSHGKIFIDKNDLSLVSKKFQSLIGYVPQNFYLIDDTLIQNIIFGEKNDQVKHKIIEKILKEVSLSNFVNNLPLKLETIVGSSGKQLSGGQAQRLAIARALYQEPYILIFDEATNSLDEKTEKEIIENINSIKSDKTIILITHKNNLLKNCNKIFKLENKKIIQIK